MTSTNVRREFVSTMDAYEFVTGLPDNSVDLIATDPPYFGIVDEAWDNQWANEHDFAKWLVRIFDAALAKLTPTGSLLFFGGIGCRGAHPFFKLVSYVGEAGYTFRNLITWKKRRAYGKSHDYLFCREEIAWFSRANTRTDITFNIPLTTEKRGYAGFNAKYPAKSEYKRVSNVWTDIPELMKTERTAQKPIALFDRIVATHSNPGQLVVDPFAGWGTCGVSALKLGRRFAGCDIVDSDASAANDRCLRTK